MYVNFFFFHLYKVFFFPLRDIVLLLSFFNTKQTRFIFFLYLYSHLFEFCVDKNSELCPLFLALSFSRVSPVFVIIWNALNHKWLCLFKNLRLKQKNIQLVNQISLPKKTHNIYEFRLKQPYLLLVLIYFYQNISRIVRVFFRCMRHFFRGIYKIPSAEFHSVCDIVFDCCCKIITITNLTILDCCGIFFAQCFSLSVLKSVSISFLFFFKELFPCT